MVQTSFIKNLLNTVIANFAATIRTKLFAYFFVNIEPLLYAGKVENMVQIVQIISHYLDRIESRKKLSILLSSFHFNS